MQKKTEMKLAVVMFTVPPQPLTLPLPQPHPNIERQNVTCEHNFLWFALCSVMNRLDNQTLSGKEPVHFLGRSL